MGEVNMKNGQTIFMVRAGNGSSLINVFLEKKVVAIAWKNVENLTKLKSLDDIKEQLQNKYPKFKTGQINNFAGQLNRFKIEFLIGQNVISYDSSERVYYVGKLESDYIFNPSEIEDYPHLGKVNWFKKIYREQLSISAMNSLGSALTIFKLSENTSAEILKIK